MGTTKRTVCTTMLALALLAPTVVPAQDPAAEEAAQVTIKSFQRAESDRYFGNIVKAGGLGKLYHTRVPTPVEVQTVVRMNRDTLYSSAVFDLDAGPATITLPDAGTRFMSIQTVTEDHYSPPSAYAPTSLTLTRKATGTRYAMVIIRTFANANSEADIQAANSLQDQVRVEQPGGPGKFEVPNWDPVSLNKIRDNLAQLQTMGGCADAVRMGLPGEVDPVCHLLATATGWGLNPPQDAAYSIRYATPGAKVMTLTVKDVPVDGFWSITVYNQQGFLEKNDLDSYSINDVTAQPNADGSYTIQFGDCTQDTVNCLVTPPDWNYTVRMYRPREAIRDGSWEFPQATP
jgi:hypothetical protein